MKNPQEAPADAFILSRTGGDALNVAGDSIRLLADAASTGGRLCIFEENVPPGGGPPLHRHEHDDEYFYVVEGRFRFVMDGKDFVAEPGAFVAAPRGSQHTFCNVGETRGRMLIVCTPAGLERCFRKASASRQPPTPETMMKCFEGWVRFEGEPIGKG